MQVAKSYNHPVLHVSNDLQTLRFEQIWASRVLAIKNTVFPASCKVLLLGLRSEIAHVEAVSKLDRREDGLTPIYFPNLEARTGLSVQQIGDNLKAMAEAGIIKRKLESVNGRPRVYVSIETSTMRAPSEIALEEETGRGGKRTKKAKQEKLPCCPDCGSYDVTVQANKEILCRTEGVVTVVKVGKPKIYSERDHDIIISPTQEEIAAYPPSSLDELPPPQELPPVEKTEERPYAQEPPDAAQGDKEISSWGNWAQVLRPEPPLICHGPACNNVNPHKFKWLDLLAQYECMYCATRARGRT